MENRKLISSVALFSELYNSSQNDIFDIIGDFIIGICAMESKYSFTSNELRVLMNSIYGFEMPEGVIRSVLNKRLKDKLTRSGVAFHLNSDKLKGLEGFDSKLKKINDQQELIFQELISFIETKTKVKLNANELNTVRDNFYEFLIDNGHSDKYSNYISAYIVKNDSVASFREILSAIKEGIILYDGIKYTPDLNELGKWKHKLTIYLSTEYLFHAEGLNGEIYQEMFFDFFNLIREINTSSNLEEKIITLKYFSETKNEINRFFETAELIKKGRIPLVVSKPAMTNIVKSAKTVADISLRKSNFFLHLSTLGIHEESYECPLTDLKVYNLEDEGIIAEIKSKTEETGREFNERDTLELISIFTKINALRKGDSRKNFERIGHLYVTETSYARFLGHSNLLKVGEDDFSYCKEMDFLTTKFWFHLNKGFSKKQNLPKSFDLINKARIILSSHLNSSVSERFDDFTEKIKKGELNEKQIKAYNYELKSKISTPEKINIDSVDDSLQFLEDDNYLNNFYDEILAKEVRLSEQETELKRYRQKEAEEKEQKEMDSYRKSRHEWATNQFNEEKKQNKEHLFYFLKALIPELIIIIITVVLFRLGITINFLKNLNLSQSASFWVSIVILLSILNFVKIYFVDKEKVKTGWKILKRPRNLFSNVYKQERIQYFEAIYSESVAP